MVTQAAISPPRAFAVILHAVQWGSSLMTGIERARNLLKREDESTETRDAMERRSPVSKHVTHPKSLSHGSEPRG